MTIDKPTSDALHRALLRSTTLVDEGRMTIDREELRRLCESAAPGPWTLDSCDEEIGFIHAGIAWIVPKESAAFSGPYFIQAKTEDAAFIASARTAVPALLDALEAAEAREKRMREAGKKFSAAYVRLMEAGRDRIVDLGGDCDPLDKMEAGDPWLRDFRAVLAEAAP